MCGGVWGVGGAGKSDSVKPIILVINYIYEIDKCCNIVFGILIPCCLRQTKMFVRYPQKLLF